MKFALATPALNTYPAAMAPWEPRAGGVDILRYARKADSLSWNWLTLPEHIVMPSEMKEVMGPRWAESIVAAATLMGATERIHMLTYILPLPYRHPLLLAKQIATMEFLPAAGSPSAPQSVIWKRSSRRWGFLQQARSDD